MSVSGVLISWMTLEKKDIFSASISFSRCCSSSSWAFLCLSSCLFRTMIMTAAVIIRMMPASVANPAADCQNGGLTSILMS